MTRVSRSRAPGLGSPPRRTRRPAPRLARRERPSPRKVRNLPRHREGRGAGFSFTTVERGASPRLECRYGHRGQPRLARVGSRGNRAACRRVRRLCACTGVWAMRAACAARVFDYAHDLAPRSSRRGRRRRRNTRILGAGRDRAVRAAWTRERRQVPFPVRDANNHIRGQFVPAPL